MARVFVMMIMRQIAAAVGYGGAGDSLRESRSLMMAMERSSPGLSLAPRRMAETAALSLIKQAAASRSKIIR